MSPGKMLGIIGGLVPLVYIGFMLRHFVGVGGGTAEGIVGIGLGPTVIGLAIVGLLFTLPLIVKLLRAAAGGHGAPGAGLKPGAVFDEPAFDADAAFANYMRNRNAGGAGAAEITATETPDDMAVPSIRPSSFGRKGLG